MKTLPDDIVAVLIPDGEWEVLTNHVKNCFSAVKEVKLYVMSSRRYMPSRYSRYISNYTYVPPNAEGSAWIEAINREMERHKIDVILPVYQVGIETLIKYKTRLNHPDKLVPLPELESFQVANNKRLLATHMKKHEIPHPKSYQLSIEEHFNLDENAFPILAKPESATEGGKGIQILRSRSDLEE